MFFSCTEAKCEMKLDRSRRKTQRRIINKANKRPNSRILNIAASIQMMVNWIFLFYHNICFYSILFFGATVFASRMHCGQRIESKRLEIINTQLKLLKHSVGFESFKKKYLRECMQSACTQWNSNPVRKSKWIKVLFTTWIENATVMTHKINRMWLLFFSLQVNHIRFIA